MIIPYEKISEQTLRSLIEDFVTREGTDYGLVEMSMQAKSAHLLAMLKNGDIYISYDDKLGTCGLMTKEEAVKAQFQTETSETT